MTIRAGYKDGSGKDIITLDNEAIAKTNWGCSCCEYSDPDREAEAKLLANFLSKHEKEIRKIFLRRIKR